MNIGLDIDNVITAFDSKLLKEILIEDKNKRNAGIIDKNAKHIMRGMFDWSELEMKQFFAKNMEKFAKDMIMRKNAKKYIDKLMADGHRIVLISHRA